MLPVPYFLWALPPPPPNHRIKLGRSIAVEQIWGISSKVLGSNTGNVWRSKRFYLVFGKISGSFSSLSINLWLYSLLLKTDHLFSFFIFLRSW
jgi:hypothetical protein